MGKPTAETAVRMVCSMMFLSYTKSPSVLPGLCGFEGCSLRQGRFLYGADKGSIQCLQMIAANMEDILGHHGICDFLHLCFGKVSPGAGDGNGRDFAVVQLEIHYQCAFHALRLLLVLLCQIAGIQPPNVFNGQRL